MQESSRFSSFPPFFSSFIFHCVYSHLYHRYHRLSTVSDRDATREGLLCQFKKSQRLSAHTVDKVTAIDTVDPQTLRCDVRCRPKRALAEGQQAMMDYSGQGDTPISPKRMPRRIGQIKRGEPPAGGQQVQAPQESPAAVCTGANGQGGKACSNLSNGEGRVRVNTRDAQSPARRSSPTQEETSSPLAVSCPPAAGACQPEVYTRGRGGCRVLCVH